MNTTNGKTLIILYEIGHIDIVLAHFGAEKIKSGHGPVIVPIDYGIELALRDRGIPFHSMMDYSARSSLKERGLLVSGIMRQMYTDAEFNFFEHNGIHLGKIIGYSFGEYVLRVLYHLDIFDFILGQFKNIETVYIPESLMKLPSTVGQLAIFEVRVGIDMMAFLAQKKGISLHIIPCTPDVILRGGLRRFKQSFTRGVFIRLIKIFSSIIALFRKRTAMKIFVSDYWWHIDSFITKMNDVEVTMMERKEVQNAREYLWKYKIRFNHPRDYSTIFMRHRAEKKRQFYEQMWQTLDEHSRFSQQFMWYGINFWEVVRPAYEHLVTSFSKDTVEAIEATERIFKKQGIGSVILRASQSGQIHFPILGLVAHKMSIPAIELQHGLECSGEFSLSVYKNADTLASYGPLIKKEIEGVHGTNLKVLDIGSPRFDQYRNKTISEEIKSKLRKKLNIDPERPVLLYIATDIVLGQTHDTYSMLRLFKNIAEATRCIEGLQVIIKIRPGPATEYFLKRSLKEAFGERCCIAQYENLHELISIANVVASSFSTVVLETMIAEKPVVLVGFDKNDLVLMESHFLPYEEACALRIARTKEELVQCMRTLVSNPAEAVTLVNNANNFLKKNFSFDGKSAERTAVFLEALRD
ncbi:MAG: hypothetical protein A3B07_02570 [Candidatus Yonathbacteria bacterium RIFCSPLOWO2_01_FULL_43_27]|uniref:Uncharacterized protein n=1 Tax=Candidatus Yonathbacteria bacterium RIFCSPLOWO2_01_FULL_43_27 TaxID=1802726 RepID=A0A1G2SBS3_9BACT|nr:MAG: hypothetical protein A3B07_02570 [Candidatus Yonathbacteria bacterium RIFCSPLOWO2_01_FULL_43_27]